MPDSVASALAMSVLLQPGGPYSSTPRGGDMPILKKASGCLSGHSTTCTGPFTNDEIQTPSVFSVAIAAMSS